MRLQFLRTLILLTLAAALLAPPALLAQQDAAPAPLHVLKIGALQFTQFVGPTVNSSFTGPDFVLKDGTLSLQDHGSLGKGYAILWTGVMGTAPLTFTVKSLERGEEIDDASGTPIWSYAYEAPALTLDMGPTIQPDLHRTGTLTDAQGHTLWTGTLPLIHGSMPLPKQPGITSTQRGSYSYQYGLSTATLLDTDGHVLWTGQPVGNTGLLVKDPQARGFDEVIGTPGHALPPGKVLTLTLSAQPGTVTLQDANHQALEMEPITVGRYSAAANNKDDNRFYDAEVRGPQTLVSDVQVALPPGFAGTVYLVYQAADGTVIKQQRTTVVWGAPFTAADGKTKAHMDKKTVNIDASGRETGGGGMSGDFLLTDSP